MSTIVLYLGGMAGDFLVSCLNPAQFESIDVMVTLKPEFGKLKKFWQMTTEEKRAYINSFSSDAVLSSHDTDFSKLYPNRTIRITCSDSGTLLKLSSRFRALNRSTVIEHLCEQHNFHIETFDQEYSAMCTDWINGNTFPVEFDIANIYTDKFVNNFVNFCDANLITYNLDRVTELHNTWRKQNENFNR